jgi:hypothetical protein
MRAHHALAWILLGRVHRPHRLELQMMRRWRRLDEPGLEVLNLRVTGDGVEVRSSVVYGGEEPFGLRYVWTLDDAWRTRSLCLDVRGDEDSSLMLERAGPASWRLNGQLRPDLEGCDEVDVSATPFCNSLAIRHLEHRSGELVTVYVDVPKLSATPSRQRYEALGASRWRYLDLGVVAGFEALLDLDEDGLVCRYEGLFEALGGVSASINRASRSASRLP